MCSHSLLSFPDSIVKHLSAGALWVFVCISGSVRCRVMSWTCFYVPFLLKVERRLNIRLGIENFTLGNCPTCRPGAGSGTLHSGLWVWISPFRTLPSTAASTEPVEKYDLRNCWALSVSTGYKATCSVWQSNIPECQLAGALWPSPLCLVFSPPQGSPIVIPQGHTVL